MYFNLSQVIKGTLINFTSETGGSLHFFWCDTQLLRSPKARPHFLQRKGLSPKNQYVKS